MLGTLYILDHEGPTGGGGQGQWIHQRHTRGGAKFVRFLGRRYQAFIATTRVAVSAAYY